MAGAALPVDDLPRRSIEELFAQNADMRLLELRHTESGRPPRAVRQVSDVIEADVPSAAPEGAQLRVAIAAAPRSGVIPGALVGIAIDVFNDGTAPAPESTLLLSLPLDAEYRRGTLRVDGRETLAPERLFTDGLPIGRLPGNASTKIIFQMQVLAGLTPLYLQPRLSAANVPIVGTPGLSIKRGASAAAPAAVVERPFYELTEDEHEPGEVEAALPLLPPVEPPPPEPRPEPPAAAPPPPPVAAAPAPPPPDVRPAPTPAAPVPARGADAPERVFQESLPPPPAASLGLAAVPRGDERMPRFRTLVPADVVLLRRLFDVEAPGTVAHYLLISKIACYESDEGTLDEGAYATFLRSDAETLGRALVLARLGKTADYTIEQSTLDRLSLQWVPGSRDGAARRRLRRDVLANECSSIANLLQPSNRDPHLRLRIALLALSANALDGVPRALAEPCVTALTRYRSAVLPWLVPLCVASGERAVPSLPPVPPAVDQAGTRLVEALHAGFAEG